jgi:hypothetical protein
MNIVEKLVKVEKDYVTFYKSSVIMKSRIQDTVTFSATNAE